MKPTPLPTGGRFISPSFGGSVASANAPRVSMIRFTQSNCTAVRGADPGVNEQLFFTTIDIVIPVCLIRYDKIIKTNYLDMLQER